LRVVPPERGGEGVTDRAGRKVALEGCSPARKGSCNGVVQWGERAAGLRALMGEIGCCWVVRGTAWEELWHCMVMLLRLERATDWSAETGATRGSGEVQGSLSLEGAGRSVAAAVCRVW
jgi:hypothetical protein